MRPVFARLSELDIPPQANVEEEPPSDKTLLYELEDLIRKASDQDTQGENTDADEGSSNDRADDVPISPSPEKANAPEATPLPHPPLRAVAPTEEQKWVASQGVAVFRRLHGWAKQVGNFDAAKRFWWLAQTLQKKKLPSQADAKKGKQFWEKALKKGFR